MSNTTGELLRPHRKPRYISAAALATILTIGTGCQTPAQHAAAMAEARRLRGQTAYDGFPSFGEPYGPAYDREVEAQSVDAATRPTPVKH